MRYSLPNRVGRLHLVEVRIDLDVALLAGYFGKAARLRQQRGADQIHFGITASRPIVDRRRGAAHDGHAEERCLRSRPMAERCDRVCANAGPASKAISVVVMSFSMGFLFCLLQASRSPATEGAHWPYASARMGPMKGRSHAENRVG